MNATCDHLVVLGLAALLTLTVACGEEDVGLYSRDQATAAVRELLDAWKQGDKDAILARCEAPFLFGKRTWKTRSALEKNLTGQLERLWEDAGSFTDVRAWSWGDLMGGSWPRNRPVKEEDREQEVERLGIQTDGFLVLATRQKRRGWLLVVNPGPQRLVVQGILP